MHSVPPPKGSVCTRTRGISLWINRHERRWERVGRVHTAAHNLQKLHRTPSSIVRICPSSRCARHGGRSSLGGCPNPLTPHTHTSLPTFIRPTSGREGKNERNDIQHSPPSLLTTAGGGVRRPTFGPLGVRRREGKRPVELVSNSADFDVDVTMTCGPDVFAESTGSHFLILVVSQTLAPGSCTRSIYRGKSWG